MTQINKPAVLPFIGIAVLLLVSFASAHMEGSSSGTNPTFYNSGFGCPFPYNAGRDVGYPIPKDYAIANGYSVGQHYTGHWWQYAALEGFSMPQKVCPDADFSITAGSIGS